MDEFDQPVTPLRPGPDRRGRLVAGLLAATVVLAAVVVLAVAQPFGPAPSPLGSIGLVSFSPPTLGSPSAAASGVMPPPGTNVPSTPAPSVEPTPPATYAPGSLADQPTWRVALPGGDTALIVDPGGRVVDAAPAATRFFTANFTRGILPGSRVHAVDVYWRGSVCDAWATVTLDADNRVTVIGTPLDTVCTPGPTMHGLELRFASAVDASGFRLDIGPEEFYSRDSMPVGAAFSDAKHGVVAMDNRYVTIADTSNAAATWRLTTMGAGRPAGIALVGTTTWLAISCDPSMWDHCAAGVYRRANGVWTRIHAMDPGPMAVQGDTVAVLDQPLNADAPPTGIDMSSDGGATWRSIPVPCSVGHATGIALGGTLDVVCQASAASDALSDKALWVAQDDALTIWTQTVLPESGTKVEISMAPGGPGVLWGTTTPPFFTDGGGTWIANSIADGNSRMAKSGDAQPDGTVTLLVYDPGRSATLLLRATDGGATWTELTSFRDLPCCGG